MADVDMTDDRDDGSFSSQHRATSSHGSGHGETGTAAEYWKQHGALKASYLDEVNAVFNAFRTFMAQDSSTDPAVAAEKKQLEFYMEYVAFCKLVLDESAAAQDAPRPWDDLARVRKYIQSVVTPYMARMAPPVATPPPSTRRDNDGSVHVAWAGRRHNSTRGGRPAIDRSVGGVPASYMNHAAASSSGANSPVGASSHVSMQSDDAETSSTGGTTINAVEYWRQHAALKDAHFETCQAVYHAFRQFLVTSSTDHDAPQRQKLTYLLGFVEFCCHVLSESSATHPARPVSDLKRVVKSVNKIITPYRHKIGLAEGSQHDTASQVRSSYDGQPDQPTRLYDGTKVVTSAPPSIVSTSTVSTAAARQTTTLPSVQDLLNHSNKVPPNKQPPAYAVDRKEAVADDEYWHHKSQLQSTYLAQVVAAHAFFDAYLHQFASLRSQEHIQDVVHLSDYADHCRQVLSEDRRTSLHRPPRTLQELHHVYTYITTLVLPHFASLQAELAAAHDSAAPPPSWPPNVDKRRMSRLHQHTDSFLQTMEQPQPPKSVDKDLSRASSTVASTAPSGGLMGGLSAQASAYWRKHAALKELYHEKVSLVQTAFRKYAAEFAHAKSAAEARKLSRLYDMLEHVEFSAKVFDEQPGQDAPRDLETLDIVHRCIMQIVGPYCQQVEAEART